MHCQSIIHLLRRAIAPASGRSCLGLLDAIPRFQLFPARPAALGFDDHFKRLRTGRFSERVVSFQNAVKRKMVSNQKLGIDLPRLDRLEQHGRAESIHQSGGNGYVV